MRKLAWTVVALTGVLLTGCGGAKRAEREEEEFQASQRQQREREIFRLEQERDSEYKKALDKRRAERQRFLEKREDEQKRLMADMQAQRVQDVATQDAERERRRQAVEQAKLPPEPIPEVDLKALNDGDFYEAVKDRLEYHAMRVLTVRCAEAQDSIQQLRAQLTALNSTNNNDVDQFLKNRAAIYEKFETYAASVSEELAADCSGLEDLWTEANERVKKLIGRAAEQEKEIAVLRGRLEGIEKSDPNRAATEAILQANEANLKAIQAQFFPLSHLSTLTWQSIQALEKVDAEIRRIASVMKAQGKTLSSYTSVIHLTGGEKLHALADQSSPEPNARVISKEVQEIFEAIRKLTAKDFAREIPDDVFKATH